MLRWIRKLVLAVVLVAVPFQGMAATLAVLPCHGDSAAHAGHGAKSPGPDHHDAAHDHHDGGAHEHQAPPASDGGDSLTYHLCCNLSASAPASFTLAATLPDFTLRAPVPDSLRDLHDPEQPLRPPLA
jgi:hypothetical protein